MNQPILPRHEGEELYSFEGKHVVPLYAESGSYREWEIGVGHTLYAIVQEGDEWTLLSYEPRTAEWPLVVGGDVDQFLVTNKLILAQ